MKLLYYSDLHLEFSNFKVPRKGFDVAILAGDIHLGEKGVRWAKEVFPEVPVIYVCGNHEYYEGEVGSVHDRIRAETENSNVHFCENETVRIGDTWFIGATLWTDFCVHGTKEFSMEYAWRCMNDYYMIKFGERKLKPQNTEQFHKISRQYLESELKALKQNSEKKVVVTHHAPSSQSLVGSEVENEFGPAYASSLESIMHAYEPDLWIHGHTHKSVDYQIGDTRVVSNPRGYSQIDDRSRNDEFQPVCIIDL